MTTAARTVMFHVGRSGSGVLGDLLDQHPRITWDGEIVKPRRLHRELRPPLRWLWPGAPLRAQALLGVVQRHIRSAAPNCAYGLEVKFFHLERERVSLARFLDDVRGLGIDRFIILRRRNMLRTVVSGLVAAEASTHHTTNEPDRPTPVVVDPERVPLDRRKQPLLTLLERWDTNYADLEARLSTDSVLHLTYEEDLAANPLLGYERVCTYLDVPPAPAQVRLGRTNPFPLEELVINLDEVRAALAGTTFAWMAEDG